MPSIIVKSTIATGRRRAGMQFTKDPQTVEVDAATLKILKGDKYLVVEEAKAKTPPPPPPAADDLTAKELIEKIKTMEDVAELGKLFKDEKRSTVTDALKARIKELKK